MTPIIKAYCSDMGFKVCETAIQCLGGYGYCKEYPLEQYLRDAKIMSLYEGTNGIQAMDLVMRKLRLNDGGTVADYLEGLRSITADLEGTPKLADLAPKLRSGIDALSGPLLRGALRSPCAKCRAGASSSASGRPPGARAAEPGTPRGPGVPPAPPGKAPPPSPVPTAFRPPKLPEAHPADHLPTALTGLSGDRHRPGALTDHPRGVYLLHFLSFHSG